MQEVDVAGQHHLGLEWELAESSCGLTVTGGLKNSARTEPREGLAVLSRLVMTAPVVIQISPSVNTVSNRNLLTRPALIELELELAKLLRHLAQPCVVLRAALCYRLLLLMWSRLSACDGRLMYHITQDLLIANVADCSTPLIRAFAFMV